MLLCLSRTTWHTNMDFPHIESIDRAFSVEYWLMESIISAWTIRFKTDFQTQNLGFLSRNTITVSQYIKTEKNYFLIHTCIWFSSNKIVARFPKYLRQITSWKAGWDDIRLVNEILLTIYQPQNFRSHLFQLQYLVIWQQWAREGLQD